MKRFALALLGFVAAVAVAATYFGYNPSTGLEVFHGSVVDGGANPVALSGTCGGTIASKTVGSYSGTLTAGGTATTCPLVATFPSAAPNGWSCYVVDETTPADVVAIASETATAVTFAGTVAHGDVLFFSCNGF